jgi:acetylornithine deacetylase
VKELADLRDQVAVSVDGQRDDLIRFLRDLVRTPSVTGDEGAIQALIADRLRRDALEVDVWEPDWEELRAHPAYVPVTRDYHGRPNVVARLPGRGGGRSLLLNGHVDTIPAGAAGGWMADPYSGEIRRGRLYGRGASDMKSGLAAMTAAVEAVARSGTRLRGDVIVEYTVDEELSGNGTLAAVLRGYRGDAGVCCETSSMHVQPASIGRIWFEITVKGRPAGIQRRWEGVNAIDKGYFVNELVREFESQRVARVRHPLYPEMREAIPCMVGVFESGAYHSAFPDTCLLKGSIATVPGEIAAKVKDDFVDFIRRGAACDPWLRDEPPEVAFVGYFADPSEIPIDSPIVGVVGRAFERVCDRRPSITGRQGAADTRHLNTLGGTPTVIFGPGRSELMHANNEWVAVEDVVTAAKVLAETIVEWCA